MDYSVVIPIGLAGIAAIVWLVRLEGRVNGKADSTRVTTVETEVATLKVGAAAAEDTKIEVVRLQEQVRHLTDLLERYFIPAQRSTRKTSS